MPLLPIAQHTYNIPIVTTILTINKKLTGRCITVLPYLPSLPLFFPCEASLATTHMK